VSDARPRGDLRELRRLEHWFYRAPSAHNTQPWLLDYERERIVLRFDPDRWLAASDPTKRDLLLGLGALVESLLVVAASEQVPLAFEENLGGLDVGELVPAAAAYESPFTLDDLERRQTSRLRYDEGRLDGSLVDGARALLGSEEALHEVAARDVLPLFVAADHHMYESQAGMLELRRWVRLSPRHPDYRRDGLTFECLDLSRLEARLLELLLRPAVYRAVRATRLYRAFTAGSKSLLDVDGSVLVLARTGSSSAQVLESGRSLMRVWLHLSAAGLYTHPLSQVIDSAVTERRLADNLGLSDTQRILSVFRAGRSDPPPRSHRLA
jgi:hypothetical protein